MKEKKLNVYLIVLVAVSVFMCAFDFFTGYISSYVNRELPLGASLAFGTLHIMLWVAYALFFIITVLLLFAKILRGTPWIILTLALTAALLIFVRSGVYAELYHSAFCDEREEIINGVLADDMTGIIQTNTNSYFVGDVRISNDAVFDIFEYGNKKAFVFEVYRPTLVKRVLVYMQDGIVPNGEFDIYGYNFADVKDLGDGWYLGKLVD